MTIPDGDRAQQQYWSGDLKDLRTGDDALKEALSRLEHPIFVVDHNGEPAVAHAGAVTWGTPRTATAPGIPLRGFAPALSPSALGDESFKKDYGIKYAYVTGSMYRGISSKELVVKLGKSVKNC